MHRSLGPCTLMLSGCALITHLDDYQRTESTGTNSGGGGAATSTSAGGTGGAGASGTGGADCGPTQADPANCGACNWSCGPESTCADGVCTAVRTSADASAIAVRGDDLITQTGVTLSKWPVPLLGASAPVASVDVNETGSGFLLGTPTKLYYRTQIPANDGFPDGARIVVCDTAPSLTCPATARITSFQNDHINGAAIVGGTMYFVRAAISLFAVPIADVDAGNTLAPVTIADDFLGPGGAHSDAIPFLMEYDPVTAELWWSTFAVDGNGSCVYHHPPTTTACTNCPADCAIDEATVPFKRQLTASPAGVFVATSTSLAPDASGPIYEVDRSTKSTAAPIALATARAPIDSDDRFLYAWDTSSPLPSVVAITPGTGSVVARASVLDSTETTIRAVDASSADWVYFSSETYLYRWRKPAAP